MSRSFICLSTPTLSKRVCRDEDLSARGSTLGRKGKEIIVAVKAVIVLATKKVQPIREVKMGREGLLHK